MPKVSSCATVSFPSKIRDDGGRMEDTSIGASYLAQAARVSRASVGIYRLATPAEHGRGLSPPARPEFV